MASLTQTELDMLMSDETPLSSLKRVFQVAILLTRLKLPKDIIPWILELGDFTVHRLACLNTKYQRIRRSYNRVIHSQASIPADIHPKSVRSVIYHTISDEGWNMRGGYGGAYFAASTTYEAGIIGEDHHEDFRIIVPNESSGIDPWHHRVKWSRSDKNVRTQHVLDLLETGKSVAIGARASDPHWTNYVRGTSITFEYLPVRKVP